MVLGRSKKQSGSFNKLEDNENEDIKELILPVSKLRFCGEQLQNLNYIFTTNWEQTPDPEYSKSILLATSIAERLVQRLVCGIGIQDSRFTSKFLIATHDSKVKKPVPSLEYIIRLDSLSQPTLYATDEVPKYSITEGDLENCPPGYARIRLHPPCNKAWAEFINPSGYLRRDKIQTKVAELLATAASGTSPESPLSVDESTLCGSPGKVVDAFTLHNILQKPANQQVFYGDAGKNPRFPDPRDFKLAIVDKPNGILLRIGFLSPALSTVITEVRLLVGIGLDAWPSSTNFPSRIAINHSDSVLYYRAAQTGMYLTGYGVHSTAWQIRVPAAETLLERHYSNTSALTVILQTLCGIPRDIDEEYRRHQVAYRILNRFIMQTCMFYELEVDLSTPTQIIINWCPHQVSTIVLRVLDKLIQTLRKQTQPNYFFPTANLFANPGHLCEDDFLLESNKIKAYMLKLFDVSLTSLATNELYGRYLVLQRTEVKLLRRWKDLVDGLVTTSNFRRMTCIRRLRARRVDLYSQYTTRQVEYIGIVLKNMLTVKHLILQSPDEIAWAAILKYSPRESAIEDIIYILVSVIQQSRDEYMDSLPKRIKASRKLPSISQKIEDAISSLMEMMRKENDVAGLEVIDDSTLVNVILKWLHKGLEHRKKHLKRVLYPYLKKLFAASHGTSYFLEAIQRNDALEETSSLCTFAMLVNAGRITPAQGLIDSVIKNWNWAKNILSTVEEGQLRLLFIPERGKVTRHILSLPNRDKSNLSKSMNDLKVTNECSTLSKRQSYFSTLVLTTKNSSQTGISVDFVPPHCILRDSSPMQLAFSKLHRNGEHRCGGDVLATLLAMQKVNIVREVSTMLPDEEHIEILEAVQKLQNERHKSPDKSNPNTFIKMQTLKNPSSQAKDKEKYTPTEESAGIRDVQEEKRLLASKRWNTKDAKDTTASLIGSCRAARIREDNSVVRLQENFKMQSLKKHSSFKY